MVVVMVVVMSIAVSVAIVATLVVQSLTRAAITSKQYYAMGNNVDQAGSVWDIDAGDCRVMNPPSAMKIG